MKPKSKVYYRNKADKLFQRIFVETNPYCLLCGRPTSCGHHFFPKSTAGGLRYSFKNMVPVCQGCHFSHHNGRPELHAEVLKQRGQQWYDDLVIEKRQYLKSDTIGYYKDIIDKLSKI